jgi:WhiB family redox-sensing transcriptional regulator
VSRWIDLGLQAKLDAETEVDRPNGAADEYLLALHRAGLSDMIAAIFDRPPWMADAACRGMGADAFFTGPGQNKAVNAAKAVCARCSVTSECRALAISTGATAGVWAGVTAAKIHSAGRDAA